MRRRTFLGLMGALAAVGAAGNAVRPASAAEERITWWKPQPSNFFDQSTFVALEWRYLAGRITSGAEDFGFVVSLIDYNPVPVTGFTSGRNELLVMRQDMAGTGAHVSTTYSGTLSYDAGTATYSFVASGNPAITATWRLDTSAQHYTLTLASPELTLSNLLITPAGDLIPEGGDGDISSGIVSSGGNTFEVRSDYWADWTTLSLGGKQVGLGRFDMQTIKPQPKSGPPPGPFSHHWFALAATLEDNSAAWVSGWEIRSGDTVTWCVTVARGAGATWSVASIVDEGFAGVQPIDITILEYQAVPDLTPPQRTGKRWRFQAGQAANGDVIDLDITVPPGQFIVGSRGADANNRRMQEAVATAAAGSIGGKRIVAVPFAVVESTYEEPGEPNQPPAKDYRVNLPLLHR